MDTNLEHGLSCKVINTMDEFGDNAGFVRSMIHKYLGKNEDKLSIDQIMNIINLGIEEPTFFLFLALNDGMPVGLMTAHAVNIGDMSSGAMIHMGAVDEKVSKALSDRIIDSAMNMLFEWAELNKMPKVYAQTTRNEKAFDKLLLKSGWNRFTTVYEKEIKYGRREEGSEQSGTSVGAGVTVDVGASNGSVGAGGSV